MRYLVMLLAVMLTISCEQADYGSEQVASAPAPAPMAEGDFVVTGKRIRSAEFRPDLDQEIAIDDTVSGEQYLAYSHQMTLETDHEKIEALVASHLEKCRAFGADKCLVTGSNIQTYDEYSTTAMISLQIVPDLAGAFLDDLSSETMQGGGRIVSRNTYAENLTRSIIDTDARLKAQITLRDRLQDLLAHHEGKLGDLIEIERELARVQGQIDSLTSNLKAMRARVNMSSVTINYQSKVNVTSAPATPLKNAFSKFFNNVAEALAAIVTFFAYAVPWTIAGLFLLLVLRLVWRLFGLRFPWQKRA
ncbi:MAG: DUF4349 domain-containing protein [bacterium]